MGFDTFREVVRLPLPSMGGVDFGHVSPSPADSEGTALSARVDAGRSQQLFLWEDGNMPGDLGLLDGYGYDPTGFRPTVTSVPVPRGVAVEGAVLLCAGGAFSLRGDNSDCYPTARGLAARGYACFVVDYRVHPYRQGTSGVDLARAIRFVRAHWREYGLPDDRHIAVGGFSAGGILCGEVVLHQRGLQSPAAIDMRYVPDDLDNVSADVSAVAMIYSFYGRLSWAETRARELRGGDLPPTFYCYGTRDPFFEQFEGQAELLGRLGCPVRARVLEDWPHGFGAEGDWIPEFDRFAQKAFARG